MDNVTDDVKLFHTVGGNTEKPTCSSARPKVTASVPVQNQVAAQKTSQPDFKDDKFRGRRHMGKDKVEDSPVITLDEWERRKLEWGIMNNLISFKTRILRDGFRSNSNWRIFMHKRVLM